MRVKGYGFAGFVSALLMTIGWSALVLCSLGGVAELAAANDTSSDAVRNVSQYFGVYLVVSGIVGWALFVGLGVAINVGIDAARAASFAVNESRGARQSADGAHQIATQTHQAAMVANQQSAAAIEWARAATTRSETLAGLALQSKSRPLVGRPLVSDQ